MNKFLERIALLRESFDKWQCDAVLIDHPIDLFYLTGLRLSAGRLLIARQTAQLFVDGRYQAVAQAGSPIPVSPLETSQQNQFLNQAVVHNLAFDSATMSYDQYLKSTQLFIRNDPGRVLVPITAPLRDLRVVKSEEECDKMRRSAALTKEGVRAIYAALSPGVTEKALAWLFERFCREQGAEKMAFDPIIAFGENTSYPHHHSSERPWRKGEAVLIDVGCVLEDYASDVTRTVWSEQVPPAYSQLHTIVVRAQKAALALCRPGTRLGDLDAAARQVMRDEGVEALFVHSLGHGIGLETHEFPRISIKTDERDISLQAGMVVTIEPGLYAAGICGSRQEDTVIVRKEGPENLYHDLILGSHV